MRPRLPIRPGLDDLRRSPIRTLLFYGLAGLVVMTTIAVMGALFLFMVPPVLAPPINRLDVVFLCLLAAWTALMFALAFVGGPFLEEPHAPKQED